MIEPIFFSDPYVGPEVVMADFKEVYLQVKQDLEHLVLHLEQQKAKNL